MAVNRVKNFRYYINARSRKKEMEQSVLVTNLPLKSIVPDPSSSTLSMISCDSSFPRLGSRSSKMPLRVSIVWEPLP